MRVRWAAGALVAVAFGCGKGSSGGGGSGGGGAAVALTVQVSGRGSIQATGLTGDCHAGCTQSLPQGTQVHLVATPDSGARFEGWQGACSGTAACDLTMTQDAQATASFSEGPALVTVVPVGTGTGHVTSTPQGIDCPGTCNMTVPGGTAVSLTPRADPGSAFRGWGGGCSGPGGCSFSATADRTVFVDFALSHTLTVTVAGAGSVISSPAGINCPGVCAAPFAAADPVALTAVPQAGSVFIGWTGACTGAATCTVALSADAAVAAKFEVAVADDCAGVVPAALGTPVHSTITGSSGPKNFCDGATSDLAGNVAGLLDGAGPGVWSLWASDGTRKGTLAGTRTLLPQAAGYQGVAFDPASAAGDQALFVWGPDGAVMGKTVVASGSDPAAAFDAETGGSVTLVQVCANGSTTLTVRRFGETGALRGSFDLTGTGCADGRMAAIGDALDRTLLALSTGGAGAFGFPPNHVIARWLQNVGTPLTDWFDVGPLPTTAGWGPTLRPLIGGGAVLMTEEIWFASFRSGIAAADKLPAFAADHHDLRMVRGKKAYALVPFPAAADSGSLDLFSASGRHCGGLQVKAGSRLEVGADGTVMALSGADGCAIDWWSGLLR